MPLTLSIKKVPEAIVSRIKERARRNHRSLQGELLATLEESVLRRRMSAEEAYQRIRALGFRTPDEATAIIRADRDASIERLHRSIGRIIREPGGS